MILSIATIPASMNVAADSLAQAGVALSVVEYVLPVAVVISPVSVCRNMHIKKVVYCWFMS